MECLSTRDEVQAFGQLSLIPLSTIALIIHHGEMQLSCLLMWSTACFCQFRFLPGQIACLLQVEASENILMYFLLAGVATGQIDFTWSTYQYLTWPGQIDHLPGQAINQYLSQIYVTNTRYLTHIDGTNTSHRRPSARPQAGLQQLLLPPKNFDHNLCILKKKHWYCAFSVKI